MQSHPKNPIPHIARILSRINFNLLFKLRAWYKQGNLRVLSPYVNCENGHRLVKHVQNSLRQYDKEGTCFSEKEALSALGSSITVTSQWAPWRLCCLLNRLFRRRSNKTSKLCVTGLCAGNSPVTGPVMRKMFPFDDVNIVGNVYQMPNAVPSTGGRAVQSDCEIVCNAAGKCR